MSLDRFCPTGHHWLPETSFELLTRGRLARDCKRCTEARARHKRIDAMKGKPFLGLDIDRIHYKLGKVNAAGVQRQKMAETTRRWWDGP